MKMYGMGSRASLAFRPVPPLPTPPKHYRAEITMLMSPSRVKQVSMAAFVRVM